MLCSTCAHRERWRDLRRGCGNARPKIARIEFRLWSNSFDGIPAAVVEFAAVQRGWRDFRIAQ
jgi:hypothetical protein